jgi:hypothetical protein
MIPQQQRRLGVSPTISNYAFPVAARIQPPPPRLFEHFAHGWMLYRRTFTPIVVLIHRRIEAKAVDFAERPVSTLILSRFQAVKSQEMLRQHQIRNALSSLAICYLFEAFSWYVVEGL